MRTARGFTIIDLLLIAAVVPMVALSVMLVPPLTRVREAAKRTVCAANLNALGKGFQIYNGENADRWPWMSGKAWDTTPTGKGRNLADVETERCVTALPFMVIRTINQSANLFVCPSDTSSTGPDMDTKDKDGNYALDFSSDTNMSYSYASPMANNTNGVINGQSGQDLVVMTDKTPAHDGGKADTDWSTPDKLTWTQKTTGMSQNHYGEYINLLFIDCHVGNGEYPMVKGDNIYSASGKEKISAAGVLGMKNHTSYSDSYLIGPIGDKKTTTGPATSGPATKPSDSGKSY